jgi:predicted enzyme related to lactoylglutathione lyase
MYTLEKIDINLHVTSLEDTFAWYKTVLNWDSGCDLQNDRGECLFGDVHYSYEPFIGFNLHKAEQPIVPAGFHPLIKATDIDALYQQVQQHGVDIVAELRMQHWGRTFQIKDCNGFVLEFWAEL